ncbi:MAG: replication protein [Dehalococcoidia bacterium]|jgi:phage replication O-like protein O
MARPQLEDGHIKIACELGEALAKVNLSACESRVIWCILRKTYGWNKKTDRISYSQFEEFTGMKRRHIGRTITLLIARQMVTRHGEGQSIEYGIQKDYEQWRELGRKDLLAITQRGNEPLPNGVIDDGITQRGNSSGSSVTQLGNSDNHYPTGDKPLPNGDASLPKGVMKPLPNGVHTKAIKHLTTAIDKSNNARDPVATETDYLEFVAEEAKRYPDLDCEVEFRKFKEYWSEGGRKLKRPRLGWMNWLQKAREIKQEGRNGRVQNAGASLGRRLPQSYTQPEDFRIAET